MPQKYEHKIGRHMYIQHTKETLDGTLTLIKGGIAYREASETYNIPLVNLRRKIHNKNTKKSVDKQF